MDKWVVSCNGTDQYYDTFQDALKHFGSIVHRFVFDSDKKFFFSDPMPFDAGCFFNYKFENRSVISDEEIVVYTRLKILLESMYAGLKMLPGSMWFRRLEESSNDCLGIIRDPIDYHGTIEEFEEELDIKIDRSDDDITAKIVHSEAGDDTYLVTNAFNLRDDQKSYYYKTHQIIRVTDAKESYLLGTSVDLDLTLKHVTEEE